MRWTIEEAANKKEGAWCMKLFPRRFYDSENYVPTQEPLPVEAPVHANVYWFISASILVRYRLHFMRLG
jgi:hypothetical protein